jgi:prepilin-type N-terminal cleavage/methylation domain-containing protein
MRKKRERRGFTLIELMVVILIVGILAAVAVPILRGKIDQAKWSEAAATAGAIRTSVRAYYAENPTAAVALAGTALTDATAAPLGFKSGDLTGKYFDVTKFTIATLPAMASNGGRAAITVTAGTGLTGTGRLDDAAGWVYSP